MSDLTAKDFTALFVAQRALDRASTPAFEAAAQIAIADATRFRNRRLARRGLIAALAAAVLIAAVTLLSRSKRSAVPTAVDVDINHWSPPTDVLLRMSREALGVPELGTSGLHTPTGN